MMVACTRRELERYTHSIFVINLLVHVLTMISNAEMDSTYHTHAFGREHSLMVRVLSYGTLARCTLEVLVTCVLALFYVGLPPCHTVTVLCFPVLMVGYIVYCLQESEIWAHPQGELAGMNPLELTSLVGYTTFLWASFVVGARSLLRARHETMRSLGRLRQTNWRLKEANRNLLNSSTKLREESKVLREHNSQIRRGLESSAVAAAAQGAWRAAPAYSAESIHEFTQILEEKHERLAAWRVPACRISVTECVASNRSAEVFKAQLAGVGEVCMKRMLNLTQGTASQLLHEILLLSKLRHPNVVQFLGACVEPPHFGLLTEWMSLGSLWHLLHDKSHPHARPNRPPGWQLAKWRMATDAARGMCYLHAWEPALVHRDLKPLNLLVDARFRVKVADFGHSLWDAAAPSVLASPASSGMGTPAYLAPELISGVSAGEVADVYSFGIILWELFAERMPYEGHSAATVLYQVVSVGARPALKGATDGTSAEPFPTPLSALIEVCWSAYPEQRPTFEQILRLLLHMTPQPNASPLLLLRRGRSDEVTAVPSAVPPAPPPAPPHGRNQNDVARFAVSLEAEDSELADYLKGGGGDVLAQLPMPLKPSQLLGRELLIPLLKDVQRELRRSVLCSMVQVNGRSATLEELQLPLAHFHRKGEAARISLTLCCAPASRHTASSRTVGRMAVATSVPSTAGSLSADEVAKLRRIDPTYGEDEAFFDLSRVPLAPMDDPSITSAV